MVEYHHHHELWRFRAVSPVLYKLLDFRLSCSLHFPHGWFISFFHGAETVVIIL